MTITIRHLVILLALLAGNTLAQEPAVTSTTSATATTDDDSDLPESWRGHIAPFHRTMTRWINNTSRGIDGFFGNADGYRTDNESYLQVNTDLRWTELESWENSEVDQKFRLDLPTAKERLRLIFESDPGREERGIAETLPSRATNDEEGSGSLFGLGGTSRRKDPHAGWVSRVQGGIRLHTPIDTYARITFARSWWMGSWEGSTRHRADWFDSDGYSLDNRLDFSKPLSGKWLLRYTTDANWEEEIDKLVLAQSANLTNILSHRSAITYSAGIIAESLSSTRAQNFFLVATYRRDLHRQLLFFELIPEVTFPREADFDATWGITARLELYFRGTF